MDKKFISRIISKNIYFIVFTILMTVYFMRDVNQALYTPDGMGVLNVSNVKFNIFYLQMNVIQGSYNKLYKIFNYPLIPLLFGAIYNIYLIVKVHKSNKID